MRRASRHRDGESHRGVDRRVRATDLVSLRERPDGHGARLPFPPQTAQARVSLRGLASGVGPAQHEAYAGATMSLRALRRGKLRAYAPLMKPATPPSWVLSLPLLIATAAALAAGDSKSAGRALG